MKSIKSTILFIILLIMLTIFTTNTMGENTNQITIYVGGTGTGNYTSIQDAIDAADDNDVIYVYNGTYQESLNIDKSITLVGENNENTIIDGQGESYVVKLNTDYVTITSFTIQNSGDIFPNAGINVGTKGNVITDNRLVNNYYGMVLLYPTSHNTISNNYIANNNQCGIYFSGAKHNILRGNIVYNQPFNGFGLYDFSDYNIIENNTLSHNKFCGINIRDSFYNQVDNNRFIGNNVGIHIPPPECSPIVGKNNIFLGNSKSIEEERDLIIHSEFTSVFLLIFGFYYLKRKYL